MALGVGAVLFLLSPKMRPYAWVWIALSALCGIINRYLANHWYKKDVIPWGNERTALKAEIEALRASLIP